MKSRLNLKYFSNNQYGMGPEQSQLVPTCHNGPVINNCYCVVVLANQIPELVLGLV